MKCPYREGLLTPPRRMLSLPIDERGYPVPWFVQWLDANGKAAPPGTGRPEFRIMDGAKRIRAVNERRCWVCGEVLGKLFSFVIGPMCALNRVSSEPPSHPDCADYSARACPFLTTPHEKRREDRLPEGIAEIPGMIRRNPGVTMVWKTTQYWIEQSQQNFISRIGDPEEVSWFCEGRPATRAEVKASVESGLPILRELAATEGPDALSQLATARVNAEQLFPTEVS